MFPAHPRADVDGAGLYKRVNLSILPLAIVETLRAVTVDPPGACNSTSMFLLVAEVVAMKNRIENGR